MSVVSLFAGCGGLDLGAIRAGQTITTAYELDQAACDVYPEVTGHPVVEQCDLTRFDLAMLPDAEGIIGGPPCQDFSVAGRKAGADGARNLWPVAIRAVEVKRPDWFLFENVKGLMYLKRNRPYFQYILKTFEQLGYRVDWRLLNAADYGVPQTRERVFVVGRRDGHEWNWPKPTHFEKGGMGFPRWISWYAALKEWLATEPERTTIPEWVINKYRHDGLFSLFPDSGFFNAHPMHHDKQHRPMDKPAFTIVASNKHRACVLLPEGLYSGGWTNAQDQHRDMRRPSWTVCASNKLVDRILVAGDVFRVDVTARCILQTLPTVVNECYLIGNAVPPLWAESIFKAAGDLKL